MNKRAQALFSNPSQLDVEERGPAAVRNSQVFLAQRRIEAAQGMQPLVPGELMVAVKGVTDERRTLHTQVFTQDGLDVTQRFAKERGLGYDEKRKTMALPSLDAYRTLKAHGLDVEQLRNIAGQVRAQDEKSSAKGGTER